jgi:hypothetical protein
MNYEVFPVDGGFGYEASSADGAFRVRQETLPGAAGIVRMTEAEAHEHAQALILANAPAEPDAVDAPVEVPPVA